MTRVKAIWRKLHSREGARGAQWERRQEQQTAPPAPASSRPACAAPEPAPDITFDVDQLLEELRAHRASIIARIARIEDLRRPKPTRPPDALDEYLEQLRRHCERPIKATWWVNEDLIP